MRKKILITMMICLSAIALTGCSSSPVVVNIANGNDLHSNQFAEFVRIGDKLAYDSATRIVYRIDETYAQNVLIPYYAPNGLPYKYNPETNTMEQIEFGK
jgi:uncharacterized protein YceK